MGEQPVPRHNWYQFELMKTDWFTEIPSDLGQNWLIKCAPEGIRVMLVSDKERTVCYDLKKRSVLKIKCNFPGGGGLDASSGITVLDCIYNKNTKTIFVLDCLCWNKVSMVYAEAQFRFFWLKAKFNDNVKLSCCKKFNFVMIDHMPAQRSLIQDAMFSRFRVNDKLYYYDGIVFYQKNSHYFSGYSLLVGWLASYMLPEILHIEVSPEHLVRKPEGYCGVEDHLQIVEILKRVKNKKEE